MACGEYGEGKMSEPTKIIEFLNNFFSEQKEISKKKLKAIVTSGPTKEYIDSVRYISNNSSGKQGYEIAKSLLKKGVETTLITGPTNLSDPKNLKLIKVQTGEEMYEETKKNLPVDIAVCAAAVGDFKISKFQKNKIKKQDKINLELEKNRDILNYLSTHNSLRPKLVIGFAAETNNIIENGGWHFANLKSPEQLLYKYQNMCETKDDFVFNRSIDKKYLNIEKIKENIEDGKDIIGRNDIYEKIEIDNTFPSYILENKVLFKDWIV